MAKYSRTEKYEELRSRLQNNHEEEVLPQTKELAAFEKRLKKINDADYEEDKVSADLHDPIHAHRQQYLEEDVLKTAREKNINIIYSESPIYETAVCLNRSI